MKGSVLALFVFHLRAGVRVATRASALVIAAIGALLVVQTSPAAFIAGLADAAFQPRLTDASLVPLVALALVLPAWAAPRISSGLNGWMRHLPVGGTLQRRGVAVALVTAQLPLFLLLVALGVVAHAHARPIAMPGTRWMLVLIAGAIVGLPVTPRRVVVPLGLTALAVALVGSASSLVSSVLLLAITDVVAGDVRPTWKRPPGHAGVLLHWHIAWRSLGVRMLSAYAGALLAIGAGSLAIANNRLEGRRAGEVARFAGAIAVVLCMASLANQLALRRPAWPFARSLPWSSSRRVADDAIFLAAHSLPILLLVAVQGGRAALPVLALPPFFAALASGHMRRIPEQRSDALLMLCEGLLAAALLTLVPWSALGWTMAAIPALRAAARRDRDHRVTRWAELAHDDAGDPARSPR